jgi:hypothetical protein
MPAVPAEASDAELLGRCHADERAFALFYSRYERLVAGWLMRQTGAAELTADLTAEVFAAAYLAAPRAAAPTRSRRPGRCARSVDANELRLAATAGSWSWCPSGRRGVSPAVCRLPRCWHSTVR